MKTGGRWHGTDEPDLHALQAGKAKDVKALVQQAIDEGNSAASILN
jgi:hypothetical protein